MNRRNYKKGKSIFTIKYIQVQKSFLNFKDIMTKEQKEKFKEI